MKLIQFVLIPVFLVAILIYIRRFRTALLDRLIAILLGMTAILLISKPEWTVVLAREFGVGNGTDLMEYLSITALGFFCLMLWAKLQDINTRLTQIIRMQAIQNAHEPPDDKK